MMKEEAIADSLLIILPAIIIYLYWSLAFREPIVPIEVLELGVMVLIMVFGAARLYRLERTANWLRHYRL